MRTSRYGIILLVLLAPLLRAQDVQFTCSVDRTEVPVGEKFQVTYTLSGGNLRSHSDFSAPHLNRNFLTLAGPSTSQQVRIINGQMSSSISWTYVLQPRSTGTFTVPSASITYDGERLTSNTVSFRVTKAVPQSKQGDAQQSAGDVELGDNLFIRAIPSKTDVFLGEPLSVTFKLYSRVAFQLENPIKLPRMIGFWSEDIESPTQLRPRVEVYRGKQYETYMLRKVLYFPTQTGELSIEPFEVGTTVRVRKRRKTGDDFYDRFFSDPFLDRYENVKKTLMTQKVRVNVRELPEEGRPKDFSGVVGDYEMEATLDRSELKANETATLKVTLSGSGNIRLLDEPEITFPAGVDHYDPTISEDASPQGGTLRGSKSFEYILVPRYAGKVTIPPITFSYFNLDRREYETLESPSFTMEIAEGDARQRAGTVEQEYIDYLAMDVRPVKEASGTIESPDPFGVPLTLLILMYLFPFVACAGAITWKQRYDRIHGDVAGLRRRRATRVAEKRLRNSRSFLDAGDIEAYYLEIARALWGYVQDKLSIPTSSTSIAAVVERLEQLGLSADLTVQMKDALEGVEFARFSSTRASEDEMRALYDRVRDAIITFEEAMRGGKA